LPCGEQTVKPRKCDVCGKSIERSTTELQAEIEDNIRLGLHFESGVLGVFDTFDFATVASCPSFVKMEGKKKSFSLYFFAMSQQTRFAAVSDRLGLKRFHSKKEQLRHCATELFEAFTKIRDLATERWFWKHKEENILAWMQGTTDISFRVKANEALIWVKTKHVQCFAKQLDARESVREWSFLYNRLAKTSF
jgi:hypothetical protein